MKKLFPALCMLLISAVLVSTSSYAWFSMSGSVEATGMEVRTHISSDVLIAETNVDSNFSESLVQTRSARIVPVSSIDGESFYYTVNANATGAKYSGTYTEYDEDTTLSNASAGKSKYDDLFQETYKVQGTVTTSNVIYGFVEYSFYLKSTNAGEAAEDLNLTVCNLLYNNAPIAPGNGENGKAIRVAVFAKEVTKNIEYTGALDLVTVLKLDGASNFSKDASKDKAVANDTSLAVVDNQGEDVVIGTGIDVGETKYYKVVLRLWLEGEDTSCNNETYAELSRFWSLDLKFQLGGTVINALGSETP